MKKQYIQPSMKAYAVKTANLMCGSGGVDETGLGTNIHRAKVNYYYEDEDWE